MIAALTLGLAGSLHCAGMCGPLALSMPTPGGWQQAVGALSLYHAGRTATYAGLGALFGLLGKGMAVAGMQQGLSLGAGILMVFMAFFAWRLERWVALLPGFGVYAAFVRDRMGQMLRAEGAGMWLGFGVFNGLLPCGMVYAALAGAIAQVSWVQGALFMLVFGLGTAPLLVGMSLMRARLSPTLRAHLRWIQPVLLLLAGALLIQRGLHLDLSLFNSAVPPANVECH